MAHPSRLGRGEKKMGGFREPIVVWDMLWHSISRLGVDLNRKEEKKHARETKRSSGFATKPSNPTLMGGQGAGGMVRGAVGGGHTAPWRARGGGGDWGGGWGAELFPGSGREGVNVDHSPHMSPSPYIVSGPDESQEEGINY